MSKEELEVRVRQMEGEQEELAGSLQALTSHYARLQLRLQQVILALRIDIVDGTQCNMSYSQTQASWTTRVPSHWSDFAQDWLQGRVWPMAGH